LQIEISLFERRFLHPFLILPSLSGGRRFPDKNHSYQEKSYSGKKIHLSLSIKIRYPAKKSRLQILMFTARSGQKPEKMQRESENT